MALIQWPSNPQLGEIYQSPDGDSWQWNGYSWDALGLGVNFIPINSYDKELISGGAAWNSAMTFDVSILTYTFNGPVQTTASDTTVTLTNGGANNRIDAIVVDDTDPNGLVSVIEGQEAPNPVTPEIPMDMLLVQYILVPAGATDLNVPTDNIYKENTEWATSTFGTRFPVGSIDFDSTTPTPFGGSSKCILGTVNSRKGARFTRSTPLDSSSFSVLTMRVQFPAAFPSSRRLYARFRIGNTYVGAGLYINNTFATATTIGSWQLVTIPLSLFAGLSGVIDGLDILLLGGYLYDTRQFALDNIVLQAGYAPSVTVPTITVQNSGNTIGNRPKINFIGATGIQITATDSASNNRVDVQIEKSPEPIVIDAKDALDLAIANGLIPGSLYRIYDAGVTNTFCPAHGATADDGISGFYTHAIRPNSLALDGDWKFYPKLTERTVVSFKVSDDYYGTDPTTLDAVTLAGTSITSDSPVWSPSYTNPTSFATNIQNDINDQTTSTGITCPRYQVRSFDTDSAAKTFHIITLFLETAVAGITQTGKQATITFTPTTGTNPSSISTIHNGRMAGGTVLTDLVELSASYDLTNDQFVRAYDQYSNVLLESFGGEVNEGNIIIHTIHKFPWRSINVAGDDKLITDTTFRNVRYQRGFGSVKIENCEFTNASFFDDLSISNFYCLGGDVDSSSSFLIQDTVIENSSIILDGCLILSTDGEIPTIKGNTIVGKSVINLADYLLYSSGIPFNIIKCALQDSTIALFNSTHAESSLQIVASDFQTSNLSMSDMKALVGSFNFVGYQFENSIFRLDSGTYLDYQLSSADWGNWIN